MGDALFAVRAMREMRRFREDIGSEHLCILNHSASCFLSTWSVNQCFEFAVQPDLLEHLCSFEHSAGYVFSSWSTTSAFNYRNWQILSCRSCSLDYNFDKYDFD